MFSVPEEFVLSKNPEGTFFRKYPAAHEQYLQETKPPPVFPDAE